MISVFICFYSNSYCYMGGLFATFFLLMGAKKACPPHPPTKVSAEDLVEDE